ncbi:MAG: serine protease [Acidobacteriia bacterium]|nr:serine protease [Terriglobia bacterium]
MDRIVITNQEVDHAPQQVPGVAQPKPYLPDPVPWWVRLLLVPLVLVLPLLSLAALIVRVSLRKQTPRVLQAWWSYLLTLLIISGFLTTLLVVLGFSLNWMPTPEVVGSALASLDERSSFPDLPSDKIMSGVQLSSTLRPLVLMASPAAKRWFSKTASTSGLLGAALILQSDSHGYLLATARHVADGEGWQSRHGAQKVMVSDGMNGWAGAQVVARHKRQDIALLWLERRSGDVDFRQSIANYSSVQTGEKIYVIGHPEGLNFSISNGIVSRTPGDEVLQVSAPVSPGNSGGPLYDEYGNLLGVVVAKVAKTMDPEAENLNFAVSTDVFLHEHDWEVVGSGPASSAFTDFLHQAKVRKAPADSGASR